MIDLHCHIDLYPSAMNVIRETAKRNLFTLAVTTSPRAWKATGRVLEPYSTIQVALGLHPEIVTEKFAEKNLLIESIAETKFIGEIGLDGSRRFKNSFALQKDIFESAIKECAKQGGKIISIHSRSAESEVLEILASNPGLGVPILHWFSGSLTDLKRAIDLGCWFSVGPAMLASKSGQRIANAIPLKRLLPESDGPFGRKGENPLLPWEATNISKTIESFKNGSDHDNLFENNLKELLSLC